jgi:hypothetical protein
VGEVGEVVVAAMTVLVVVETALVDLVVDPAVGADSEVTAASVAVLQKAVACSPNTPVTWGPESSRASSHASRMGPLVLS